MIVTDESNSNPVDTFLDKAIAGVQGVQSVAKSYTDAIDSAKDIYTKIYPQASGEQMAQFTTVYPMPRSEALAFVTSLYKTLLDRTPDQNGLEAWVSQLTSGVVSQSEIVEGFKRSDEYQVVQAKRIATAKAMNTYIIMAVAVGLGVLVWWLVFKK